MIQPLAAFYHRALAPAALYIHRRLVPDDAVAGWSAYIWLPYLGFLFINWFYQPVSLAELVGTLAATALFLVMYFRSYHDHPREMPWLIIGITVVGIGLVPFNIGAGVFFVYAAAISGSAGLSTKTRVALLASVLVVQVTEFLLLGRPSAQWIWTPIVSVSAGFANLYFGERARKNEIIKQSREEIRHLAATAERERIARDLHDLLGHTLTLITVKAELAGKLAERDLPAAGREIHELEKISRDALAQVREAVGGYRAGGVAAEMISARLALQTARIDMRATVSDVATNPDTDTALAMVLREAVTNIVRHARASVCWLSLIRHNGWMTLVIDDDGSGGRCDEGNGVRGMRERIEAAGGELTVAFRESGTCLRATVPDATTFSPSGSALDANEEQVAMTNSRVPT